MGEYDHTGVVPIALPLNLGTDHPKSQFRGAVRFLRAPVGTKAKKLSDIMLLEEPEGDGHIYDPVHPWEDLGASKTGIFRTGERTFSTQIAEPRFVRKTCDMPFWLGEEFALAFAMQTLARVIRWQAFSNLRISEKSLNYMNGDEVRERFRKMGEPTTIPIEFYIP